MVLRLEKCRQHQLSECHKMAINYGVNNPKSCRNVIEMTKKEMAKVRLTNRRCLLKIIENLRRCVNIRGTIYKMNLLKLWRPRFNWIL